MRIYGCTISARLTNNQVLFVCSADCLLSRKQSIAHSITPVYCRVIGMLLWFSWTDI